MKIRQINSKETRKIIDDRKPIGKFYEYDNGKFIGLDNETGDCWVEEFDMLEKCKS